MNHAVLPPWNEQGVLPPVDVEDNRSPYQVSLWRFVARFNTSAERQSILKGLLNYRKELHAAGLVQGFQWVDGSFVENVERLEGRPPRDLDVVTFFDLPSGWDQRALRGKFPNLFDRDRVKSSHSVDAYYQLRKGSDLDRLIEQTTYWYGHLSHRRDDRWKGFIQVDLSPEEDESEDIIQFLMKSA
ncbi:MAG: hypothetical protein HQL56_19780 [Magnetococcales bacterium]|nr:hypothetical protein [Magnetococcales bacterium]